MPGMRRACSPGQAAGVLFGGLCKESPPPPATGIYEMCIRDRVGTTPAAWNAGVFSLIRQLSETVILPIAGLVLTFVATYELIQMLLEKNNMHEFDVANIYKWVFKTACAIPVSYTHLSLTRRRQSPARAVHPRRIRRPPTRLSRLNETKCPEVMERLRMPRSLSLIHI